MNNSLAEVHPELVSEWSKKNKIKPIEVSIGSHKKVICSSPPCIMKTARSACTC